ncbi:MAG: DUF3592 domain-containing protein [Actinobacteria bacterium]|nr:DUF3592 domain-containing protein [Actinomycetota bacterium]
MWEFFRDLKSWAQVGLAIGLLGALGGAAAAIIASPILGTIFTVVFFGIFYFAFKLTLGPYAKQKRLLRSGRQAEGTILAVEDTGVTVNEIYPLIKVRLEVRPPGGKPYQAETKMLISRLQVPQIQPGLVVPVMYDPKDPSNVTVGAGEGETEAGAGRASPTAGFGLVTPDPAEAEKIRMAGEFLTKEDQRHQEILAIGKPAKAKILNAMNLGINVNGNNPAMTFLLEVQPEGEPSFQGQTTGVIAEAAVPKYQVGREIFVKYDPNDKTRVAIDHS